MSDVLSLFKSSIQHTSESGDWLLTHLAGFPMMLMDNHSERIVYDGGWA